MESKWLNHIERDSLAAQRIYFAFSHELLEHVYIRPYSLVKPMKYLVVTFYC